MGFQSLGLRVNFVIGTHEGISSQNLLEGFIPLNPIKKHVVVGVTTCFTKVLRSNMPFPWFLFKFKSVSV